MVSYNYKIIFGKGLDKNGGRRNTGSKQARHNSALFPIKLKLQIFKAYSARLTIGGMRFFLFCGKNL